MTETISNQPEVCEKNCECSTHISETRLIVLTGGPGAGKTAVLELIKKELCKNIVILPEAASIIFGGGFWRLNSLTAQEAAQKAIMHVQIEMENLVIEEKQWSTGLCDRGMPDSLAYWPLDEDSFWKEARTTLKDTYKKYYSVIHLRTPDINDGYNHQNPLRIETAEQARLIDEKIHKIWKNHPNYKMVEASKNFLDKAQKTIDYIIDDLPECCKPTK